MFRDGQISSYFAVHVAADCMIMISLSGYLALNCSMAIADIRQKAFVDRPAVIYSLFVSLSAMLPPGLRDIQSFRSFFYGKLDSILMLFP